VAFNLTLLSYCGSLDMGLHLDPAAVTEPGRLRSLLADAFDELIDVGARVPARSAKKARPAAKATKKTKGAAKRAPSAPRGARGPATRGSG
jgi:hypothetical protein